jgi:CRP/FNR family cyclic AMP-dependent transcriptional regulator
MGIWEAVAHRGTEVRFGAGEALLRHGEIGRHCYAIRVGEVLVTATSTQGATVVLGRRGPGSVIGELSALDGAPRSATVRAIGDVVAVVLTADEFESLLRDEPDLALSEIRRLSRQFRELSERYSVRGEELRLRVVQLLGTHAAESGDRVFRSTREELAGWVGATREAVIRALRELERDGTVILRRGSVELTAD